MESGRGYNPIVGKGAKKFVIEVDYYFIYNKVIGLWDFGILFQFELLNIAPEKLLNISYSALL